jgi:hypothetical protein
MNTKKASAFSRAINAVTRDFGNRSWHFAHGALGWLRRTRMSPRTPQGSAIMRAVYCAAILAVVFPPVASAAGLASNANFIVYVPAKPSPENAERYAKIVLERAQQFRDQVAQEWLGERLPEGGVRTIITIDFTNKENSGFTWAKDNPQRQFHNVYLNTSPAKAAGTMLNHEIAHTVLATKYPHPTRLSKWVEEGIASRYDDEVLRAVHRQEVRSWIRMGRIPPLNSLLNAPSIDALDDTQYAAAESLVEFLVTRGDKPRVVEFAEYGQRAGWDNALRTYYRITDVQQLQAEWQQWLLNGIVR